MSQPHPANRPDPPDPQDPEQFFQDDLPKFAVGQCVVHRRYGYRGVVVDFDMSCHADEQWYQSNQTQPDIEQPWYHVLVHDSTGNTYVAQENLLPDYTAQEITHPLVSEFFENYNAGRYTRNDAAWPTW